MMNWYLCSAFLLQSHSPNHTQSHNMLLPIPKQFYLTFWLTVRWMHQGQHGIQILAQGYVNTCTGEAGVRSTCLLISRWPTLAPEPLPVIDPKHTAKVTQQFLGQRNVFFFSSQVSQWGSSQMQRDPQTSSNWRQHQWIPSRASQERKYSIWWCPWGLKFRESLTPKDFHPVINNNTYI